jgi:adenylate cyclase
MPAEIERKFLLQNDGWREHAGNSQKIAQGYLANTERGSVRVRLKGDQGYIGIKSMTLGVSRVEFEYPIPVADAEYILHHFCLRPIIEKTRFYVEQDRHTWEIDVFDGDNAGLEVAEIELDSEDEVFHKPDWLGAEVSADPRYYNVNLIKNPYKLWQGKNNCSAQEP